MDKSVEPRLPVDTPVQVTVLGEPAATMMGRIQDHQRREVRLQIDQSIPVGSAVKLEWDRTLLLGEVSFCHQQGEGFCAGLELEHALYDTEELARLARRLLDLD